VSSANRLFFLDEKIPPNIRLGGKAANLADLSHAGFNVPRGFVLSTEYLLHALNAEKLTESSSKEILSAIDRIGGFPVAVRSSSLSEDLAGASFAGLYVSVLDVESPQGLADAIARCWQSARSERVMTYQKQRGPQSGVDESTPRMNVLIQKMVHARHAGVTFTLNPLSGIEEQMLVESCKGLGEKLVSGQINPSRWVLRAHPFTIENYEAGDESVELDESFLREMIDIALRVQAHFKHPQDIEWAQDQSGKLALLQSRPITQISWRKDVEEFTNADFKDGGVSARVCSPMMYSLYKNAMQDSMQNYFETLRLVKKRETWIDFFYGRPYWNASAVKRGLRKVPGFSEKNFDNDLGVQKDYGAEGPIVTPSDLKTILGVLPTAFALPKEYAAQLALTKNYGAPFLAAEKKYREIAKGYPTMEDGPFFNHLEDLIAFHKKTESDYFRTIYNNSTLQTDFKTLLLKATDPEDKISLLGLMSGLQNIGHLNIQRGLLKLYKAVTQDGVTIGDGRWRILLQEFLSNHYFHADAELDLTCPRWEEVPERIEEIIKNFVHSNGKPQDPDQSSIKQNALFEAEKEKALTSITKRSRGLIGAFLGGGKRKKFLTELEKSRVYMSRREEMREYSSRTYALIRAVMLETGLRLKRLGFIENAEHVFLFYTDELIDLVHTRKFPDILKSSLKYRELQFAGLRDLIPPNELGQGVAQRQSQDWAKSGALVGAGCSPGVVIGSVRVIKDVAEAGALLSGEILVTRFTDPGWTPVLGIAAGVITEVGGVLSHAAVIGREYGIPAILNLPGATQLLNTGQKIRMNGESGVIEIL